MLVSFRAVLARSGARPLALACGLGWLSFAAYGLAIVLAVRAATGSFASAGAVVAAFSAASALLAPLRGRTVDRRGPRALTAFALAHVTAMSALALGCALHAAPLALALSAALAGAAIPPLIGTARTLWPPIAGPDLTRTAHALNATLGDLAQVTGPALVGTLSTLTSPTLALSLLIPGVATGCALLARLSHRAARSDASESSPRAAGGTPGDAPIALASSPCAAGRSAPFAALRALLLVEVLLGVTFGALDVAAPVVAQRNGHAALAAVPLAAFALGSVLASLWSGGQRVDRPASERYVLGSAVVALALAPAPLLHDDALAPLTALLVLGGAGYGLLNVAVFELLPDRGGVEAFTWLTTAAGAGLAVGAALAGVLATQALIVVALPALGAAAVAVWQRPGPC